MSEEQQVADGEETPVEEQQQAAPEPTPIEVEAAKLGWRPKEEWDASSGKKWRSAEEFMDRKSLFDKIDEIKAENRRQREALHALTKHNAMIEKKAYERALEELKQKRKAAIAEGEIATAEELRDQIDDVKEQMNNVRPPDILVEPPREFQEWQSRNDWYGTDDVLTNYADGLGTKLAQSGMSPREVMLEVERQVKGKFPAKFRNPNKDAAPREAVSSKRTGGNDGYRLTAEEERIITTLISSGAPITREEYIKQLKATKGN